MPWVIAGIAYTVLAVLLTWPVAAHLSSAFPHDAFDPVTRWPNSDAFVNVTVVPGATRAVVGTKAQGSSFTVDVSADVGAGMV